MHAHIPPLYIIVYLADSPRLRCPDFTGSVSLLVSSLWATTVPRATLPLQGVTLTSVTFTVTLISVTRSSSLILAHAPDQNPLTISVFLPCIMSLHRLLRIPAGRWPFPTLSLRSLYGRMDPYPATTQRCFSSVSSRWTSASP